MYQQIGIFQTRLKLKFCPVIGRAKSSPKLLKQIAKTRTPDEQQCRVASWLRSLWVIIWISSMYESGHYFNITGHHRDPRTTNPDPWEGKENKIRTEKSNGNQMQSPQFRSPVLPHCEFQKNESIIWVIIGERAGREKIKANRSEARAESRRRGGDA
uniref:Uncharacterized protein n=1 Tax=Triticum urartu TaxID=4572 RepID=A0A8R7QBB4_TRIUA